MSSAEHNVVASRAHLAIKALTCTFVALASVAALFHNEFRAQNWDPQQARVNVERALRFGGTYYENALLNKGPLEPLVYRLANIVTSWDGYWFAISALVIVAAAVIALAAQRTAVALGSNQALAAALAILVYLHFIIGKGEYAGVLYSRNMVVAVLAGGWMVALDAERWTTQRSKMSAILLGALLGVALQTLFVAAIAVAAIVLLAFNSLATHRHPANGARKLTIIGLTIGLVLAAPLWYALRGTFAEFWSGWWTYAKYQNTGTGRSLANQLVYGRDVILRYYRAWPLSTAVVVGFVAVAAGSWTIISRRARVIHLGIIIWFLGAWIELVMSQRYSGHYFSVLAAPTALMAVALVSDVYALMRRQRSEYRHAVAWPLAACLLGVVINGGQAVTQGLQAASNFTSVSAMAEQRRAIEPGEQRTVRAMLDMVSEQNDPLLAWTEFPWTYLAHHRVSATRWIWKSFMLGQIYLGRTSEEYVLENTWQWFADDMKEANPAVFLEEVDLPLAPGTPFAAYVEKNFTLIYSGSKHRVYYRNDLVEGFRQQPEGAKALTATAAPDSDWKISGDSLRRSAETPGSASDQALFAETRCVHISGTLNLLASNGVSFLSFNFEDPAGEDERVRLNMSERGAFSGNDNQLYDSVDIAAMVGRSHEFDVVVGQRSAVLLIDGEIVSAVRLDQHTRLSLEARTGGVDLTNMTIGSSSATSGC